MNTGQEMIHGPYTITMPTGNASTGGRSSSKPPAKAEIYDYAQKIASALPMEADVLSIRNNEYFNRRALALKARNNFNIENTALFGTKYGQNIGAFWQGEASNMSQKISTVIQMEAEALAFRNNAIIEKEEYENSDLNSMTPGTPVPNEIGHFKTTGDILKGDVLLGALNRNAPKTLRFLGIDASTEEVNNLLAMRDDEMLTFIAKNKKDITLTSTYREQIQSLLPLGYGFDDVVAIDFEAYYKAMETSSKRHGQTKIGIDGEEYIEFFDADKIGLAIDDFYRSLETDPGLSRTHNYMLQTLGRDYQIGLASKTPGKLNRYVGDFNIISKIKDEIGETTFDKFITPYGVADIIGEIENSSIDELKKEKWINLLSDDTRVKESVAYNDIKKETLSDRGKLELSRGILRQNQIDVLSTYYKTPQGGGKLTQAKLSVASIITGNGLNDNFSVLPDYNMVINTSTRNLASEIGLNIDQITLSRDIDFIANTKYLENHGGEDAKNKFWKENAIEYSNYAIYESKGAILDKFINAVNKNPSILGADMIEGDMIGAVSSRGKDYGDNLLSEIVLYEDPESAYKMGVTVKKEFGPITVPHRYTWEKIMKSDELREWANKNLSEEEQAKLWDTKDYLRAGAGDFAKIETIQALYSNMVSNSGTIDIERYDIQDLTEDYSENIGKVEAAGDIVFWDASTGNEVPLPFSGYIMREKSLLMLPGQGKNKAFVETYMIIPKDQLDTYMYTDKEDKQKTWGDIYGKDRFTLKYLEELGDKAVKEYVYQRGGYQAVLGNDLDKKKLEEYYYIPVPIVRDRARYGRMLDTGVGGAVLGQTRDASSQVDNRNKLDPNF